VSKAWIALGSNSGDRASTLTRAVALLQERGIETLRVSHLYETRPEFDRAEPPYLNGVLEGRTALGAHDLIEVLRGIEVELGRPTGHPPGPRTCDLDLLSLGDDIVEGDPDLSLPHPRLHRRSFVLVPLCELDVHWKHPILQRSAGDLLAALPTAPGAVRLHGSIDPGAIGSRAVPLIDSGGSLPASIMGGSSQIRPAGGAPGLGG
jgi:2-amino-4-hydroxy-6-hydroxymethyldihydropteridine diphosphokinase